MRPDVEIHTMQQGSLDWFAVRRGIPTASRFSEIIANGRGGEPSKVRRTYMHKLAGEILTGATMDSAQTEAMLRGQVVEDEARDWYAMKQRCEPEQVGFLRLPIGIGHTGASLDSLVGGGEGLLEIKTRAPHLQVEALLAGVVPGEHLAQCQGQLWISGARWLDYLSYCQRMPPLLVRVERDEGFIESLSARVGLFCAELRELVETIRPTEQARSVLV
jgi:hypothetical protein